MLSFHYDLKNYFNRNLELKGKTKKYSLCFHYAPNSELNLIASITKTDRNKENKKKTSILQSENIRIEGKAV